jgi:hypothetical protein
MTSGKDEATEAADAVPTETTPGPVAIVSHHEAIGGASAAPESPFLASTGNVPCYVFCDHEAGKGTARNGEVLTPEMLVRIQGALTAQLNEEVSDEWGGCVNSRIGANDGSDVIAGEVEVAFFQHSDVAGAAGYHDRRPDGSPYMRVFLDDAETLITGPNAASVIGSHECVETKIDPGANRWADRADGTEEAIEGCDRVEDTTYTKTTPDDAQGVEVSNFLLQSAFDPGAPGPYDYLEILVGQLDMTPGGYVITRQLALGRRARARTSGGHHLDERKLGRKLHPASRMNRRNVDVDEYKASVKPPAPTAV